MSEASPTAWSRYRGRWSAIFRARSRRSTFFCPYFAGISARRPRTPSQGKIFIEAQVKEGYDLSFSIAITAVSAGCGSPAVDLMIVGAACCRCRSARSISQVSSRDC
jgi:TRAP-type C4-dicarboxylate transport system permease large subunit